ncbi:hypothetical protein AB0D08_39845 [Kitasatospora sp. NPDC048540]
MQSGNENTSGKTGKGNPWLRGALGEAAISAARRPGGRSRPG